MDLVLQTRNNMKIEKEQIVKALSDKKVICWSDLLEKLDLLPLFEKYQKDNKQTYRINQIFMGKTLLDWIEEILKARIVKSKDKRVKHLVEKYRLAALSLDALHSMPTESKEDIDYMLLEDL